MKKIVLNVLLATSLFAAAACNETKNNDSAETAEEQNEAKMGDAMEDDTEFAVEAADGGMFEVQLGQLAQKNGSAAQVKQFGQMMVNDHGKANEELKSLAQQKNITLPTSLSTEKQDKYNELSKKTGAEFDKSYMDLMVKDHKEDIEEFREMSQKGKDTELKTWATSKVPALEMHLQRAQTIQGAVK
ncbi:DUF4142 domain-containing protein [Telluribacter sp. SYSU D00476]|uniref:DUF4142 domain-containing protein n=1 Tax=Telluribacter sp. SYSU D00476 TaxID=2811430 RepID=UPI001FF4444B|nr:DUF4142 domain-containing protein [Telluribacter sp. SYSU D00476]